MQGIHEYIIQVEEAFKRSIQCGDIELYLDPDFERVEHSNRIGKVISTPLDDPDTPIEAGDQVLIVQTVLMPHITQEGRGPSPNLVDEERGYYRLSGDLIVMYRKPGQSWKCFGNNVLIAPTELPKEQQKGRVTVVHIEKKYSWEAQIVYNNPELERQGIEVGDIVYVDPQFNHEYMVDGRTLWRVWTTHLLGKKIA